MRRTSTAGHLQTPCLSAGQPTSTAMTWSNKEDSAGAFLFGLEDVAAEFDSRTPSSNAPPVSSEASPPRERDDRERSRLERIVPELVKKLVEMGVEKISEGPENLRQILSEMKLPREAILLLVAQLDETKKDVTRAIARELRDFLEKASLADEFNKLLSGLSLEIKTQIRFVPNAAASGRPKPEVKTKIGVQIDPSTQADESATRTEASSVDPDPSPELHQNSVAEQESSK